MAVPKKMQQELEKRDELILALEMLTVDQASRLLALEALVVNIAAAKKVNAADIKAHITKQSSAFTNILKAIASKASQNALSVSPCN